MNSRNATKTNWKSKLFIGALMVSGLFTLSSSTCKDDVDDVKPGGGSTGKSCKSYTLKVGSRANQTLGRFINIPSGTNYLRADADRNQGSVDVVTDIWSGTNPDFLAPNDNNEADDELINWTIKRNTKLNYITKYDRATFQNITTNAGIDGIIATADPNSTEAYGGLGTNSVVTVRTVEGVEAVIQIVNVNGNSTDPNGYMMLDVRVRQ